MAQKFMTKEQALKHIGQFRCGMVALWFISMIVIGNFTNSDIAGVTALIITVGIISGFYNEKKKVMEQIKTLPCGTAVDSLRIPEQTEPPFRRKPNPDSGANRTPLEMVAGTDLHLT